MTDRLGAHQPQISAADCVAIPTYDRSSVSCGVMHIGVGNFHRAHQAVYFENLLQLGAQEWGIIGVSLRSAKTRDALRPQNFLYTVATLDEPNSYRVIGALKQVLFAPEQMGDFLDSFEAHPLKIVTVTVTEKAYRTTPSAADLDIKSVCANRSLSGQSMSVYEAIAIGIRARAVRSDRPLTVISCDNISGGGPMLRHGVLKILDAQCPRSAEWARTYVAFLSSVVDRVVPSTKAALVDKVRADCGFRDTWPVPAEPFSQWFIEDRFMGERPPLDLVGADFVQSVEPFAQMKLRLLNATHSLAAAIGFQAQMEYVHEVFQDRELSRYLSDTLIDLILPLVRVPSTIEPTAYAMSVMDRFANANVPYAIRQVATDSSEKIAVRLFPTIDCGLQHNANLATLSKPVAIWLEYIRQAALRDTLIDLRSDDLKQAVWSVKSYSDLTRRLLRVAGAAAFPFFDNQTFMDSTTRAFESLAKRGLRAFLST